MSDSHSEWIARCAARHLEAVARGEHDDECEYDTRGFMLCHCSKRRREAKGFTELPTDPLEFPPPDCPRCGGSLVFDDGWTCFDCSLAWDSNGQDARFTDDYGRDLAADAAHWREKNLPAPSGEENQS